MIQKQIKRRKKEALVFLLIMLGVYAVSLTAALIIGKKSEEKEMFMIATLIAAAVGVGIPLFGDMFTFLLEFNIAVSMGQTRKSFVWCYELVSVLEFLAVIVISRALAEAEQMVYRMAMPDVEFIVKTDVIFQIKIIIPVILGLTAVQMFIQAMLLRFGLKAFWTMWLVWMALSLSPSALSRNQALSNKIYNTAKPLLITAAGFTAAFWILAGVIAAGILMGAAWGFLRKQQVTM